MLDSNPAELSRNSLVRYLATWALAWSRFQQMHNNLTRAVGPDSLNPDPDPIRIRTRN